MSDKSSDHPRSTVKLDLNRGPSRQTDNLNSKWLANRYRIDRLLDRGSCGNVYSGIDSRFDSEIAIKLLTPPFSDNEFRREAQLARKFRHPNVVEVYDCGIDRGFAFIVMEFLHGDRVDQLFRSRYDRLFPPELLDRFVYEITSALQNAHKQALVHRDLKPQNIMLIDEGKLTERFVLLDFGIAAQPDATNTSRNATRDSTYTPNYGAPERFIGDPTDHRTDIYSLGTILYELVTGCLPFKRETPWLLIQAIKNDPPPPFDEVAPHVSGCQQLETLIMHCLEKDRADRPQSMEEVREEYFAARQPQMRNSADRAHFVDQRNRDADSHSTTELLPDFGDTHPTIDLPDDTNRDLWADLWDKPATRHRHQEIVSIYRRRLFLTIIAAVEVTAVAAFAPWTWKLFQKPWLPEHFHRHEDADWKEIVVDGHRIYVYEKIERIILGENPVVFILVDDRDSPSGPFYIMQKEVWNGLFGRFAAEKPELIGREQEGGPGFWEKGAMIGEKPQGASNPQHPVVNVSPNEADECALWLGGRLPTVDEWNTAAGYYRWRAMSTMDKVNHPGPFHGSWPAQSAQKPEIAVYGRLLEVGTAKDDFTFPFGCRDMAGNVEELTSAVGSLRDHTASANTAIEARGKCYADGTPLLYANVGKSLVQYYNEHSPYAGFRVVIRITRSAD